MHLAEAGPPDAPPLVLLHGWPQHWWCWRRVVPLLTDSYRLLLPDLRGFGWSGAPASGYDKQQLATDLLGLLEVLDLPAVGLVAHDWGGWAGFLACLRRPDRFRAFLALGIPPPFQRADDRAWQLWRLGYQLALATPLLSPAVLRSTPSAVEGLIQLGAARPETFSPADLRTYSRVLTEPARARATALLYRTFLIGELLPVVRGRYRAGDLQVPSRLVVGAADPVVHPALLRDWEAVAAARGRQLLPGVGHFVPEEAPEVVAAAVRELLPA